VNGSEHFVEVVHHVLLQIVNLLFDLIELVKNFPVLGVRHEKFCSAGYETQYSKDRVGVSHLLSY